MKTKSISLSLAFILALVLISSLASAALTIDNVNQDALYPGKEASLDVEIANNLGYDIEEVRMTLIFTSYTATGQIDYSKPVSFSSVGSSQDQADEIDDEDSETLNFQIKASNSVEPGDYTLPYIITYKKASGNDTLIQEQGSFSIHVNSKTSLDFSVSQEKPVMNSKDKLTLKIINKGFGEIKFVTVTIAPNGFTLLSDEKVYIGSIASDDFDTANFNVLLTKANPKLEATITYKDFENNDKTELVSFDLNSYSQEKALELGLITKSNTPMIISILVILVIVWLVIRAIRKSRKKKLNALKQGAY